MLNLILVLIIIFARLGQDKNVSSNGTADVEQLKNLHE